MSASNLQNLIVISGYYGFDNLGDEAILEELIEELRELTESKNIVVLSNDPNTTSSTYETLAFSRWQLTTLLKLLPKTRLFISGGGGLFQDTTSLKPPIFYACQIYLAKLFKTKVMVYAQGLGPLNSTLSKLLSRSALSMADLVTMRDQRSSTQLNKWGIESTLTADPVWRLASKPLPYAVERQFQSIDWQRKGLLIGLSLRPSKNFNQSHLVKLLDCLDESLPKDAELILLPLQKEQDSPILEKFRTEWLKRGHRAHNLDLKDLAKPSQWLNLIGRLDLLVGMRLHSLIMALKSGVPVVGLAYDPKVSSVLCEFDQPILNLEHNSTESDNFGVAHGWIETLKMALKERNQLSERAKLGAKGANGLACKNFLALAKILGIESEHKE